MDGPLDIKHKPVKLVHDLTAQPYHAATGRYRFRRRPVRWETEKKSLSPRRWIRFSYSRQNGAHVPASRECPRPSPAIESATGVAVKFLCPRLELREKHSRRRGQCESWRSCYRCGDEYWSGIPAPVETSPVPFRVRAL